MGQLRGKVIDAQRPWRAGMALAVAIGLSATLMAWHVCNGGPLSAMALPVSAITLCATAAVRRRRAMESALAGGRRARCAPRCQGSTGSPAMAGACTPRPARRLFEP
ncbi:hypothetical protein MCHLDSM_01076 [Mycolicibacterium chlorophenolicum]|uniref:Uncharacterized protein n=1 Tax=Mycolicibacterium chlorophenolicum TaxID=37916 RepID=A0A0J6WKC1_9MYCO|nr:hypothetical protein MCHLDSM_01076 [Mycolicibacterium chlorophenolicum]